MKLGLGTVQFGLDYGIANPGGQTPPGEAQAILDYAAARGIRVIDTASLYGQSEEVLGSVLPAGHPFRVVTKTIRFAKPNIGPADIAACEQAFSASLAKLRQPSLYGLLLHHADDLLVPGGERLFARLAEWRRQGLVQKIGVSVYTGDQIDRILAAYPIELIQLPLSILDQRLIAGGHLRRLKDKGVEIHVRSVFLQGLLLMPPDDLPPRFGTIRGHLDSYRAFLRERGLTPVQAALGFVLSLPEVGTAVCGVNTLGQLAELAAAVREDLDPGQFAPFALSDETILNPALWRE
jgi:aryl-alcohol dehydrogenase-like predicted oxidoreductase